MPEVRVKNASKGVRAKDIPIGHLCCDPARTKYCIRVEDYLVFISDWGHMGLSVSQDLYIDLGKLKVVEEGDDGCESGLREEIKTLSKKAQVLKECNANQLAMITSRDDGIEKLEDRSKAQYALISSLEAELKQEKASVAHFKAGQDKYYKIAIEAKEALAGVLAAAEKESEEE